MQHLLCIHLLLLLTFCCVTGEFIKDPTLCSRIKCQVPADRKFKYLENVYYQYRYQVNVSANLGAQLWQDKSQLFIDAQVILRFITPCEGSLWFRNVSISHDRISYQNEFPDRAGAEFKNILERNVIRFAFDDGLIRELCPSLDDDVWALNIRRGVLSMFQNTMLRFDIDRRHDELDVNGICETRYQLHEARRTSLIVHKAKNLATCKNSAKHLSLIQSQFYQRPASAQSLKQPLIISNSMCEITIDHNVYQQVKCRDTHQLRPLSNGDNAGARTEIKAKLILLSELHESPEINDESRADTIIYSKRTNLLYDHAKSLRTIYGDLRTSRDLLKTMCLLGPAQELHDNFSEIFTKFIQSARMLDYQGLLQLYYRAQTICKTGRKHIIEALPYIGSNAAVSVMKDLILKKYVNNTKINFWVKTFTLIPRPDRFTIYALAPLLEYHTQIPESQFILSYSSVIYTYCRNHPLHCKNLEPIEKFLYLVENNVAKGCKPRYHNESDIFQTFEALKAIGNAGLITDTLISHLKLCIEDNSGFVPVELKLAAIEAHRRFSRCEKLRDEFFLNIYRNFTFDTELRIASYLQVMRCPDYNIIKVIRHTLEEEEVNQVGSFVWSHLKNVLTSSSPTRLEIQSLLSDRDLGNKFNSDFRKFSRSYESSIFSEEYNFGGNYQTHLIFSPKSYIPRTLSVNVTFDLFGESVNVIELNVRAEGIEYYAENLFGPRGPFSGVKVSNHFNQLLRHFRSTYEKESNNYWAEMDKFPNVIDNDFNQPRLSFSYKIFGNEVGFVMLKNDLEIQTLMATFNPWERIKEILSGHEIMHYENTAMFLDSSYIIPTTTGLPVRLDLSGSMACNIKLSGILKSHKFMSDGELQVNGNVMPSFSLDITGTFTVDAFYKSAGIKLKTSIYSVSALETELKIQGIKLVHLNFKIPNHKTEVLSFTSNILFVTNNGAVIKEKPIYNKQNRLINLKQNNFSDYSKMISNTTCSWSALDRLIGLKFCADYQFPNVTKDLNASYFLLNGPTVLKLSLIKADPTADSYLLEYKWTRTENESIIKLAFDTPGSQTQREISATISFDALNNNVTLLLKSKGNSLIAQGVYKRTENETFINVGLDSHGIKHLDANIGYNRKKVKFGYSYSPKIYLAINNERILNLSGIIRKQEKLNTSQCDIDLRFETKNLSSHIFGYALKSNTSVSGNIKIEYRFNEKHKDEILQTEFSLINRSSKTMTYKAADMKLHSTAYSQLNIVAGLRYQHALGHVEVQLEVNTSPHLDSADKHKLTAQFVATYSKPYFQTDGSNANVHLSITKPVQNIDLKVGVNYYSIGPESKTSFIVRYAPGKEINLTINIIMPRGTLLAIEGRLNLTIPNFTPMVISAKITEHLRNEYNIDFAGTWFSGHNLSARGIYRDHSTVVVINHDLEIIFDSPSFTKNILFNCKLYHDATDIHIGLFAERVTIDKYAFIFNYTALSTDEFRVFIDSKYKNSSYSLKSHVNISNGAVLHLHCDHWRDVHLVLIGVNNQEIKEYGFELEWDANRNPDLKIITNFQLKKYINRDEDKNISATMRISYPDRLIVGSCLLALKSHNNYITDTYLKWSNNQTLRLIIDTDYDTQDWMQNIKFESQLLTPFDNWKKTSLNAKYSQTDTNVTFGSSIFWHDSQFVIFDASGNTQTSEKISDWIFYCGLTSTVHSIQYIKANFTHNYVHGKSIKTHFLASYYPHNKIDIWSVWFTENGPDKTINLSGNLQLLSPVFNYRKGELKCQLSLRPNYKFYGAANLDLEKRKYTSQLIGDLAKLKESMITFNVTTPFEKYSYIRGRFGLSEKNKHLVAEITLPAGPLGIEIICQLFMYNNDFNIKLLIATPIEILQQALFVAKLNQEETDFRIAYNNVTAGFQGIWFYRNITDFHYSYILYTPLQGFHEIGVITKLIFLKRDGASTFDLDTEFSLRIVDIKAGFQIEAGLKPSPQIAFPLQPDIKILKEDSRKDTYDYVYENSTDLHWKITFELNTVIIDQIRGSLDFDEEGFTDKILFIVQLPLGTILLEDTFSLDDFFHINNDLSIETPFKCASEIVSTFLLNTNMETTLIKFTFNVKNDSKWMETKLNVNYTNQSIENGDSQLYSLKLNTNTPFEFCKMLDSIIVLEIDENYYKTNLSAYLIENTIDFFGSLEHEINYLDVYIQTKINGPILTIPKTTINAKKDFTDSEKHLEFIINIESQQLKMGKIQAHWSIPDNYSMKGSLSLNTWIEPIKNLETSVIYNNTLKLNKNLYVYGHFKNVEYEIYEFVGKLKSNNVEINLNVPFEPKRLLFTGKLFEINNNLYKLVGNFSSINSIQTLHFENGIFQIDNGRLTSFNITVTPKGKTESSSDQCVTLKFKKDRYSYTFNVNSQRLNGNMKFNLINLLNWDLQTDLYKDSSLYNLKLFMNVQVNGNTSLYIQAKTPWDKITKFIFNGNLLLGSENGNVKVISELNEDVSHIILIYHLFYLTDMFINVDAGLSHKEIRKKNVNAIIFYKNPKKLFKAVQIGFDINIDKNKWNCGTNITAGIQDQSNIDAIVNFKSPLADKEIHNLIFSYHHDNKQKNISYNIGYNSEYVKSNYASDGSIQLDTNDVNGHVRLTWGFLRDETLNNLFNITFDKKELNLQYFLFTPKFLTEEKLLISASYDGKKEESTIVKINLNYPVKKNLGSACIKYKSLTNINGTLNATSNVQNFSNVNCEFVILTTPNKNKRFLQFIWPNNSAFLDSEYLLDNKYLISNLDGHIRVEFPLNTRHAGYLTYGYKKKSLVTTGYSNLYYNNENVLDGYYHSETESRAGLERDTINITVKNEFKPIGIVYINQFEYSEGNGGTNYPTVEYKKVNIYQINNASSFNVSGISKIRTTHTGQEVDLTAVHFNRTIQLKTDYDFTQNEFNQKSWISLAENAWISYHINTVNKSTNNVEHEFLRISLVYPQRNFTINGSYMFTDDKLNSEVNLNWGNQKETYKTIGASFDWLNNTLERSIMDQTGILCFKHPSFEKDVKFVGKLTRKDIHDLLNVALTVDYSIHENKLLKLTANLRDESELPLTRKYSYFIVGEHPKTNFNLCLKGFIEKYKLILFKTNNEAQYKRSFLPEETGKFLVIFDLNKNEIELRRESNEHIKQLKARYYSNYPEYVINGSLISGRDVNTSGIILLNLQKKFTYMTVNYTPDATEGVKMRGNIPDARNVQFDIWRIHDQDYIVSDISFYVRLNHSRLVTSKLHWRPELKSDIVNSIKTVVTNIYDDLIHDAEYWRHYVRSETISIITDIWADAQEELELFLEDLDDLKFIENDFEKLKSYLNNSYNANDFYIKDIVTMGAYVIDELSLRTHIQSLPNIINEIWEIMGESGEAIRNSLLWIIETIKNTYLKLSEVVTAILKGDSMNQIAGIVEKIILKYDLFIKELHVSFIQYIEYLYNKIYQSISLQWHRFLIQIEPVFIQLTHYLETVVWKAVQEFLNFLYARRMELIPSPYYDHFTNFTQDIDKFYRDIKANDIITNIQKYSASVIQFLKERYFAFVPFGKELKDLITEILNELKELRKLPSVRYTLEKIEQVNDRINHFCEYLDIRAKFESTIRLIHSKLIDISQTALEAESRYREAKTKFIYDPNHGFMCLEQKLPMSWHAFNQTPEFSEIPEYRAIADMGLYFTTSNTTFWTLYYQIKPFTEPSNWLPPFRAQAMIVGPQHIKTFDGQFLKLVGTCTYLAAHDFVRNHFSILIKYDKLNGTYSFKEVIVLVGNDGILLDIHKKNLQHLGQNTSIQLPVELDNGSVFVYQEENIVIIERKNKEFKLECNLKYSQCILELSGWYHGKTAGIFGTMNNEQFDDTLSSDGFIEKDVMKFVNSWSFKSDDTCNNNNLTVSRIPDELITTGFCQSIFTNKSSQFSSCFNIVEPAPFFTMCSNSANNHEACGIAMSYLQTCMFYDTYLRIPDQCTTCEINDKNGSKVYEGDFLKLHGKEVPKSGDIIFIVEAKKCNYKIRNNRNIDSLITSINKELIDNDISNNRWSLVVFGGNGVYNKPRSLVLDNQIFTYNLTRFLNYFDNIPIGDGSQDIFEAIRFAAQLVFRAGVSKTFILLPCSHCDTKNQTLDYSVLYHALQERSIKLHILMDGEFQFEKNRLSKIFYGLDATRSYIKKDSRDFTGDIELRRQVKLSKHALGHCAPLALETNGTIFSGSKLKILKKLNTIRKFTSVFAKRLALTANPNNCQVCECIATNDGLTKMECAPCDYPMPVTVDFVSETFNEEDMMDMQSTDMDYGQLDNDED